MIEPGQPAPDFALESDTGETIRLSDLRGGPVVVYFYPKDETSGCTTQACDIRDNWGEFEQAGATVLGISPDSAESHAGFRANHKLPFPLLVDADHAVAEAYGAWGEKKNYGKTYFGIIRSGFVIDADGNLAAVKHNVKADRHCEWALAELAKLADRTPAG
jgi:thioredoxin-dependent peroxiredoxin